MLTSITRRLWCVVASLTGNVNDYHSLSADWITTSDQIYRFPSFKMGRFWYVLDPQQGRYASKSPVALCAFDRVLWRIERNVQSFSYLTWFLRRSIIVAFGEFSLVMMSHDPAPVSCESLNVTNLAESS